MQAVQTFWINTDTTLNQLTGGWLDIRFHLISWALSSALLKRHFDRVILHTDRQGKRLLIEELGLPYDSVHLTQEGLNQHYPPPIWVMRKIHSYAQNDQPFLHVDSDAFLWSVLPKRLLNSEIIVQNYQSGFLCYPTSIQELKAIQVQTPLFLPATSDYQAVNMGIAGGHDYEIYKSFYNEVKSFLQGVSKKIILNRDNLSLGYFNTLIEECFFYYFVANRGKQLTPLIDDSLDGSYRSLSNVITNKYRYCHLIGDNKRNLFYCKQIENKLKIEFPDLHQRVTSFVEKNTNQAYSKAGHYYFQAPFRESNYRLQRKGLSLNLKASTFKKQTSLLQDIDDVSLQSILTYEWKKYKLATKLFKTSRTDDNESERAAFLENYLLKAAYRTRKKDTLYYTGKLPILSRILNNAKGQPHKQYVSLIYDRQCGFFHLGECIWDQLALLILCLSSEKAINVHAVVERVLRQSQPLNLRQSVERRRETMIRIHELYLAGLINYERYLGNNK